MGLFGNTVPKRKWPDVQYTLYGGLRDCRARWFAHFVNHYTSKEIGLTTSELSPEIDSAITSLQLAVIATTIRERRYIKFKDVPFFVELLYILLTGRKSFETRNDAAAKLLAVNDPQETIHMWCNMMVPLLSNSTNNRKLAEILSKWSAALIIQTKIETAESCFDRMGADAIRIDYFDLGDII